MPAAKLDDYYPGSLDVSKYNGKLYGLPWIAQPVMLYYNPALFNAAGISPPDESWTWDTFKDAAKKLTKLGRHAVGHLVQRLAAGADVHLAGRGRSDQQRPQDQPD